MLKNNKGITLISLVVTIIVISILAVTVFATSNSLILDTKMKTVLANMYLVKGKVETIYEEYKFDDDNSVLVGTEYKDSLEEYHVNKKSSDLWYVWNKNTLTQVGLDNKMLSGRSNYIVNYTTGEIIYTSGCEDDNGNILYTLTEMRNNQ